MMAEGLLRCPAGRSQPTSLSAHRPMLKSVPPPPRCPVTIGPEEHRQVPSPIPATIRRAILALMGAVRQYLQMD